MSTLIEPVIPKEKRKFRRAYQPTAALAQQITFEGDNMMVVHFTDGRVLHVPIIWFPLLHEATPDQRDSSRNRGRWP